MIKNFKIDTDRTGVTIWRNKNKGDQKWVLDASMFLIDGEITISKRCFKKKMIGNNIVFRLKKRFRQ